jgi:archaemetzincin
MNLSNINLISFGFFEKYFLEQLAEAVEREFTCTLKIKDGHIDLSEYYDPARRQYNGNKLLMHIDSLGTPPTDKSLGLFSVDLFIPILTFIFGQAYLGGRSGIASLYRFSNIHYGMPEDKQLILDRFKKEVTHELGHTFGLIHCHSLSCVMRSSTYVEDIDQKSQLLCSACRTALGME